MPETKWETFFPYIQSYVSGCPELVIVEHLQEKAAQFIAESNLWRYPIDKQYTTAGIADYDIIRPENTVVETILTLQLENFRLDRYRQGDLLIPAHIGPARPTQYDFTQNGIIVFDPIPDSNYRFEGVVSLRPTLDATGVPDWIYEVHGRSIARGVIGELCMIPGKEWTNPELGMLMKAKFSGETADAKRRDLQRSEQRVFLNDFDGSSRRRSYVKGS